jgi:ketosteroid isomerase-like protein
MTDMARLLRAADEVEIRNLVARLAHLTDSDTDDLKQYISLFTDDAVSVHPGEADRKGHAEILERGRERRRIRNHGPGTNTQHITTTLWVQADGGDTATAVSKFLFFGKTNVAEPTLLRMGRYDDTFRRTTDGWKLARREITRG